MTSTLPSFRRVFRSFSFQGSSFDRNGFYVGFAAEILTQGPYPCTSEFFVSVMKGNDSKHRGNVLLKNIFSFFSSHLHLQLTGVLVSP